MNFKQQVLELLAGEREGLTAKQLSEFFPDLSYTRFSGSLSYAYGTGGLRREKVPGTPMFRYWADPEAKPEPVPHKGKQTLNGTAAMMEDLHEKIAELEAWKADALARFPELAVPPLVLRAREIVAAELNDTLDPNGAKDVLAGHRDHTPIIKAVVRTLELTQ